MDVLSEGSRAADQDNAQQALANEAQMLLDCAKASSPEFGHQLGWGTLQVVGGGATMVLGAALAKQNRLPMLWGLALAGDGVRRLAAALGDENACSTKSPSNPLEGFRGEAYGNQNAVDAVKNGSLEHLSIFDNAVQSGKPSDTDGLVKSDPGLALMRQSKSKEAGSLEHLPIFDNIH